MSDFQRDLLKRLININHFSTVRPSIKETCDKLCSIICSRIKRKESGNILLIGAPGSGKSFIIKKAIGLLKMRGFVDFDFVVQSKLRIKLAKSKKRTFLA